MAKLGLRLHSSFSLKPGRRPSNQLSCKPTNQTEKRYRRHERGDTKLIPKASIENARQWPGPNDRDDRQRDHGFREANALVHTDGTGNHLPSCVKQQNI